MTLMRMIRFGACALALVLLISPSTAFAADAPLADAAEKADRAGVRTLSSITLT
jgi:hypothetical protein